MDLFKDVDAFFAVDFMKVTETNRCQALDVSAFAEKALGAFDLADDWTEMVFADLDWELEAGENHRLMGRPTAPRLAWSR